MAASDTRQLQLQISASAELLIRNMKAADGAVAEFQRSTNSRLKSIDDRFDALGALKGKLAGLGAGLLGAATTATLIQLAGRSLDYASSLGEVSQQLGVTAKDLQTYRYAATQVGISQDEMDKSLSKLTLTMGKARLGADGPIKAFGALGISLDDLRGKSAGDVIPKIADGLQSITDPAQRAALEVELFGKAGQKLDTLLSGGGDQIRSLAAAAKDLGLVLSDDQIANADRTADKLSEVKQVLEANIAKVVTDNAASIFQLANALEQAGAAAARAIGQMQNKGNLRVLENPNGTRVGAFLTGQDPAKARQQAFGSLLADKTGRQMLFDRNRDQRAALSRGETGGLGADGLGIPESPAALAAERKRLRTERTTIVAAQRAARQPVATAAPIATPAGRDAPQILAPSRGGGGGAGQSAAQAAREREAAAKKDRSDQRRAADLSTRAQLELASARADLSNDPTERLKIEKERIEIARQGRDADIDALAADNSYVATNAARLKGLSADAAVIDDQLATRKAAQEIENAAYDRTRAGRDDQIALLEVQARLAITAKDRRKLDEQLLAIKQAEVREALKQAASDTSRSPYERQTAQQALDRRPAQEAAERGALAKDNQGPLGQYRDQLAAATDDMDTALEGVAAHSLQNLEDGLEGIVSGTTSVKDAFRSLAASIVADLAKIAIEKAIVAAIDAASGSGGSGSFFTKLFHKDGGEIKKLASGGPVFGAGGPRDDKIPAMLSNGEYVVNARATRDHYPLIAAINSGRLPRFANGGLVASRLPSLRGTGSDGSGAGGTVHVAVSLSDDLDARIDNRAAGVSVAVLREGAPNIIQAATAHTLAAVRRPGL